MLLRQTIHALASALSSQTSGIAMDPLSGVLSLLKPRSYMFRGLDAGGQWSIDFSEDDDIKCYALMSGQCWLSVEGVSDPVRLSAGDCVLLPRGRPLRLASDMTSAPIDAETFFRPRARVASLRSTAAATSLGSAATSSSPAVMPTYCSECCHRSFIFRRNPTKRRYAGASNG